MLAKIVYWTVITALLGVAVGLGISALWFLISMIPFGIFFIIGIVVVVVLGLAMGWAEREMDRAKVYKNDHRRII